LYHCILRRHHLRSAPIAGLKMSISNKFT
jgi:hypothetical protein